MEEDETRREERGRRRGYGRKKNIERAKRESFGLLLGPGCTPVNCSEK